MPKDRRHYSSDACASFGTKIIDIRALTPENERLEADPIFNIVKKAEKSENTRLCLFGI